jgi:cobalt-zinc-cadmium efflux system outer membrane protein
MRRSAIALLILLVSGCTIHPRGEDAQRKAAKDAGAPYARKFESRNIPPLSPDASLEEIVNYALLTNGDLEQRYWEWRSAIEQIPQDGTQTTNLMLSAGTMIDRGKLSWDRTTVTIGNDPMSDIVFPGKLSTAAQRGLENARAADYRFQKARYELRAKVLTAYYDYALTAELISLEEAGAQLMSTTASVVEARNRAGSAGQQDVLKAQNDVDLANNQIAMLRAQAAGQQAMLNALLARDARTPIPLPRRQIPARAIGLGDDQIVALAAERNPELAALAAEIRGKADGVRLARLQYVPDFSINTGTDLAGLTQTLMSAITVPVLRAEAINAAIAQARANLRAAEAMRRQNKNDLAARVVDDLSTLRDADRQLGLLHETILPRAAMMVDLSRSAYESGRSSLLELLDSQRSLIEIQRMEATLRATRNARLANLEAVTARGI